jgi:integrase
MKERGISRNIQRNYRYALKSYFATALGKFVNRWPSIKIGKILRYVQPFRRSLFTSKEKEILTKEEWAQLYKVLPGKFRLMFEVINGSGPRIQELLDLQVKDITFEGKSKGKIYIRKGKRGLPGKTTMTDDVTDKVHEYV